MILYPRSISGEGGTLSFLSRCQSHDSLDSLDSFDFIDFIDPFHLSMEMQHRRIVPASPSSENKTIPCPLSPILNTETIPILNTDTDSEIGHGHMHHHGHLRGPIQGHQHCFVHMPTVHKVKSAISETGKETGSLMLGNGMGGMSPTFQLVVLSVGIFTFFVLNGFIEEYLFAQYKDFKFGWYLTVWELFCFSFFACVQRLLSGLPVFQLSVPLSSHLIVSLSVTAARGLTNVSMQLLNYPTMVIFKSLKLITVMIGAVIMNGKTFLLREYFAAILLAASATMFSMGDAHSEPNFNISGIIVVLLSLAFDSIQANAQEKVLKGCPITEAILFSNFFSAVMALGWTFISGELGSALAFCALHPATYYLFIVRALICYLGVACLLLQIQLFGAVTANVITTCRKIITILLSFLAFAHPLSFMHGFGLLCFTLAAAVNEFLKPFVDSKAAPPVDVSPRQRFDSAEKV